MALVNKYLSELQSGKSFGGAATSALGKTFNVKSARNLAAESFFPGQDILSAFIRGKIRGKGSLGDIKSSDKKQDESDTITSKESVTLLTVVAKNSMVMPNIARDMNVLRQNLQQLVKLKGGQARGGADRFFLKAGEREAALEAQKEKIEGKPTAPTVITKTEEDSGGGFSITDLFKSFKTTVFGFIRKLFKPKMLGKIFSKVFLPLTIIATLFTGITDGWKKYQETGSLSEAIFAGLGGMLDFLTFGLLGEDTLKSVWDSVSGFLNPILEKIGSVFNGIKSWFVSLFGGDTGVKDTDIPAPKMERPKAPPIKKKPEPPKGKSPTKATQAELEPKKPTKTNSVKAEMEGDDNLQKLEMAQAELQGMYSDWQKERGEMARSLVMKYKDGFVDDPSDPGYPSELKAINEKWQSLIKNQKATVAKLKMAPGVEAALKRQKKEDDDDDEDLEKVMTKPTKVSGSTYKTSSTTTTGGGSKTTTRVLSADAKEAAKQLNEIEDRQAEERRALVNKLKGEGKISGRFAKKNDWETIPELKALRDKQTEEIKSLSKRVSEGTSIQTSSSGGGTITPSGSSAGSPSGTNISSESSSVSEAQRMESAADSGSTINAEKTNKSFNNQDDDDEIGDAHDEDLLEHMD